MQKIRVIKKYIIMKKSIKKHDFIYINIYIQ